MIRPLAAGGSAILYEARHRNGRRGALKILRPELRNQPRARQRLLFEAHVANVVHHRGIVRVLDDDVTGDGLPFLVLDLLEGETLEQRLEHAGPLPPLESCRIAIELLDVLEAVHEARIVHRDVKPDNIFLTRCGSLKLLDFGIARARTIDTFPRTLAGVRMGTPGYMPREQATGDWEHVDERTDLWAVGAVLCRMLTGRHVFDSPTPEDEIRAAMTCPPPKMSEVAPSLPPGLAAIVDRALAMDVGERWPSAAAMRRALEDETANLRAECPRETMLPPPPRRAFPHRILSVLAITVGVLLGMSAASHAAKHTVAAQLAPAATP